MSNPKLTGDAESDALDASAPLHASDADAEDPDRCACPGCDEDSGAGHGSGDNDGHLFCNVCELAGCSEDQAACDEPCDDCAGKGWDIFNEDPDTGELGDIQRCDSCLLLEDDDTAWAAARLAGYVVDADGNVLSHPLQQDSLEATAGAVCSAPSFEDFFGPVIHSYTRAQAIDDGVLIDVSETAKKAGFKVPTALTQSVWASYVQVPTGVVGQDEARRLWEILFMATVEARRRRDGAQLLFQLSVRNDNRRPRPVELKFTIGPGDHGEPVATILLPGED